MAKTRGSGRPSPSTTHSSTPPTTAVPLSMASPSSASPKSLAATGPPFVVPGADKFREPSSMASSSNEESGDPEVTIEGFTAPPHRPPPQNKRKSRTSLRLVAKSSTKKPKTEVPVVSAKERLDEFRKRKFAKGMALNVPWLISNLGEGLVALFEKQGWVDLFGDKFHNLIYPNELAEFYCHLSVDANENCTSLVKGEGLVFSAEKLGEILGVPATGYAVHSKRDVPILDYAEVRDLVAHYSQGACTTASSFHQDSLTPFHKLVYNVVRRSLVPRVQKRTNVEVLDVVYLDMLVTGKQINFPLLMIRHMEYMRSGNNYSLPYAPLITTILEHFNVPLKKAGQQISQADVLGEGSFDKLGVEVRDGEFCFVKEKPQTMGAAATAKEQPQEQTQGGTDVVALINEVRKELLGGLEVLFDKVAAVEGRNGAVITQVNRLTREVTALRESTATSNASLATSLAQNHAEVMKRLAEFEGATVEQEVEEEEEEDLAQEQPTAPTPAP